MYDVTIRDRAESARSRLLERLCNMPGKEIFLALQKLSETVPATHQSWIMQKAHQRAILDADLEKWSPKEILAFSGDFLGSPTTPRKLATLAHLILLDIKDDLEDGDTSNAKLLLTCNENSIRNHLGGELRNRAQERYSIPQEEELANKQRPDLRFHGSGFDAPIPVELKIADKWTGADLFERLENQLCGDYLRDKRSSYGFFVLAYQGEKKSWEKPDGSSISSFDELISELENFWKKISPQFPGINAIYVIGIDLTKRNNRSKSNNWKQVD